MPEKDDRGEPAGFFEMRGQRDQDFFYHSGANPILESAVRRLVWAVWRRQIFPRRSGAKNPEHAIENRSSIAPRAPAFVFANWIFGKDG